VSESRAERWCKKVREPMLRQARTLSSDETPRLTQLEHIWDEGFENDGRTRHDHYNGSRYYALNLHSTFYRGTVEWRCFNSTLHAGKVAAYVNLCLAISAQAIAQRAGIERVIAQVLPQEKEAQVRRLSEHGSVAMVGDGINDAPALARADVGIAIGAGADVAIESADVVLMRSDLLDVSTAVQLSRATIRNIKQNLFWALCYNSLGIPLAAGVFYTALGGELNPMFGAAAMSMSSVCVVSSALRLKLFKPRHTGERTYIPAHRAEEKKAEVFLHPDEVSLAIGKGGLNIRLATMLTGYTIDVYRDIEEGEEDIYLDEFRDEIDDWVIEALKDLGLGTAKAVLNAPQEVLDQADLEDSTIQHVLDVIKAEFDD